MRVVIALASALAVALSATATFAAPASPDLSSSRPSPRTDHGLVLPTPYADWFAISNVQVKVAVFQVPGASAECAVSGKVSQVYHGTHHRRGEQVAFFAPCGLARVMPTDASGYRLDADWLRSVKRASVKFDAKGRLVSFETLDGYTPIA